MLCIYLHTVYRFLETHIKLLSFVCFLMSGTRYDIDLLFRVEKIDTDLYNSVDRGIITVIIRRKRTFIRLGPSTPVSSVF